MPREAVVLVLGVSESGLSSCNTCAHVTSSSPAFCLLQDVGRSPRMQYHALSLARLEDVHVTLVGFAGEPCCPPVEASRRISQIRLQPPSRKPAWLPFALFGPFKVIAQILQLLWVLFWGVQRPTWVLVQNPPSIPTLLVAWLVCRLRGASLVIDWCASFAYRRACAISGSRFPPLAGTTLATRFWLSVSELGTPLLFCRGGTSGSLGLSGTATSA